ncbi:tripartite tricarboxylate transporter substrate binding protein [Xylophilus sp. GOD-11R]|uniref:Bug family tripartite tricarboxylate transporter substrate binding protein n=1 Tax=Xylophilus sp. GOD-11R TaxID=3089814 RepID=UPI00298D2000|nr:tripartite tricarboxylate transporter substrate binding protein [Xylophilus sp. GOD-11R]WPB55661.1 tripartite tricarboxylate transporter substrate binding protein [Xylophilus sp. GOD-11R]
MRFAKACIAALAPLVAVGATGAMAQDFPRMPIQLWVPYAAGGNLDVTTRNIAPYLAEELGVAVVVQNKPGAGGSVAALQVARMKPDGYNLMTTATTELSVTPHITNAAYSIKSFELVGSINTVPMVIEVPPDSRFKSFAQMKAEACAHPDTVSMGIAGIGSVNYMALLRLQEAMKCTFKMVPYNGSGPALLGVLGNQTDAILDQVSSSKGYLDSGKLKPLVVLSQDKVAGVQSVPTLRESGVQGADMATVAAIVAPAGLPPSVAATLRKALRKVMARKDVQEKITALGGVAFTAEPDNFMEVIQPLETQALRYKAEGKLSTN